MTRTDYSFNLSYHLSIVAHHRRNGQVFTQDQEELILIGAFGLFWFGKSQVRLFSGNTVRYRFHNPESISGDWQKPSPEGAREEEELVLLTAQGESRSPVLPADCSTCGPKESGSSG